MMSIQSAKTLNKNAYGGVFKSVIFYGFEIHQIMKRLNGLLVKSARVCKRVELYSWVTD